MRTCLFSTFRKLELRLRGSSHTQPLCTACCGPGISMTTRIPRLVARFAEICAVSNRRCKYSSSSSLLQFVSLPSLAHGISGLIRSSRNFRRAPRVQILATECVPPRASEVSDSDDEEEEGPLTSEGKREREREI